MWYSGRLADTCCNHPLSDFSRALPVQEWLLSPSAILVLAPCQEYFHQTKIRKSAMSKTNSTGKMFLHVSVAYQLTHDLNFRSLIATITLPFRYFLFSLNE